VKIARTNMMSTSMDKLLLSRQNLGQDFRCGITRMHYINLHFYEDKLPDKVAQTTFRSSPVRYHNHPYNMREPWSLQIQIPRSWVAFEKILERQGKCLP